MPRPISWRQLAVNAREAIRLLNYPLEMEQCLPGEPQGPGCGLSESAHFIAYLTVIKAIADHYLSHLPAELEADGILEEMRKEADAVMTENCGAH